MIVERAGFLSFVGAIAAATSCAVSCTGAGTPLPEPSLPDAGNTTAPVTDDDDDATARDAGPDRGPVCEDDDGILAKCDGIEGVGRCSASECEGTLVELKARPARKQIECIRTQIGLGKNCEGCRRLALDSACPDPASTALCDDIEAKCRPSGAVVDRAQCLGLSAALTFGPRQKFLYCATETGCKNASALQNCIDFRFYP